MNRKNNITLKRWNEIEEEHSYTTWDVAVECYATLAEGKVISNLGYYGKVVKKGDGSRIHRGIFYDESGYIVTYRGIDGSVEERFKTEEAALKHILERAQWWTSSISAHSDYAHYELTGFTYDDWEEHTA